MTNSNKMLNYKEQLDDIIRDNYQSILDRYRNQLDSYIREICRDCKEIDYLLNNWGRDSNFFITFQRSYWETPRVEIYEKSENEDIIMVSIDNSEVLLNEVKLCNEEYLDKLSSFISLVYSLRDNLRELNKKINTENRGAGERIQPILIGLHPHEHTEKQLQDLKRMGVKIRWI